MTKGEKELSNDEIKDIISYNLKKIENNVIETLISYRKLNESIPFYSPGAYCLALMNAKNLLKNKVMFFT